MVDDEAENNLMNALPKEHLAGCGRFYEIRGL
jgi:hypothetical protein